MRQPGRVWLTLMIACIAFAVCWQAQSSLAWSQEQGGPSSEQVGGESLTPPANEGDAKPEKKKISFFSLLLRGGWFMFPLTILSFAVVVIAIERTITLRKEKVMPTELVTQLGNLGRVTGGFDPRSAYRLCQQYPSSASRVIRALLLKVGRPQSEIEAASQDTSQREVDRQNGPVSWLALIATVAPLLGLLGTVWGITQAFFDLTNVDVAASGENTNKAKLLAEGIYTALVTTLCGLMIAIPAAVLAHFFESRIVKLFNQINELAASLMPQVERYEGRLRFSDKDAEAPAAANRKREQGSETPTSS